MFDGEQDQVRSLTILVEREREVQKRMAEQHKNALRDLRTELAAERENLAMRAEDLSTDAAEKLASEQLLEQDVERLMAGVEEQQQKVFSLEGDVGEMGALLEAQRSELAELRAVVGEMGTLLEAQRSELEGLRKYREEVEYEEVYLRTADLEAALVEAHARILSLRDRYDVGNGFIPDHYGRIFIFKGLPTICKNHGCFDGLVWGERVWLAVQAPFREI